ncbi:hypothetical protein [Caballeronia sp. ATUFL_F1_KS4A]|uniref:hypothetical protein n=1 Tax=Caballeronia sp. ATUFL_F1_KS4A TaxID=2921768 RepID=UPI0020292199|nr:hypothetical protein [Caballeronia sp. ATUFL_F1_KS4A]
MKRKARKILEHVEANGRSEKAAAREAQIAAIPVTKKPRRKKLLAPKQKLSVADVQKYAEKRRRQKQRRLKEQAERESALRKANARPRPLRTLTDEQAKVRLKGQPTQVVIVAAYPGYKSPKSHDVDMLDIAWQGGAPGLGRKR